MFIVCLPRAGRDPGGIRSNGFAKAMNSPVQRYGVAKHAENDRGVVVLLSAKIRGTPCRSLIPDGRTSGNVLLLAACLCVGAYSQSPSISPNGLVNAATGKSASSVPVAARGSLVSIYGNNFSTIVASADSPP